MKINQSQPKKKKQDSFIVLFAHIASGSDFRIYFSILLCLFAINFCVPGNIFSRQHFVIQYNLNGSNMDGSFTVDDSNSFFSPYKILPIAQENKYLEIFSYFVMELYVVCTH